LTDDSTQLPKARTHTGARIANPLRHFDQLLLDAVDEGLAALGESAQQTIYHFIEERFHIQRMEIPEKLQAFHEALTELIGPGATIIEKGILEKLREKMGIGPKKHETRTLVEYISEYKNGSENSRHDIEQSAR